MPTITQQERLYKLYEEVKQELEVIDIPINKVDSIKVNNRMSRAWGICKRTRNTRTGSISGYRIEISERLLNESIPDKSIKNTICHELIHTIDGCFNHGDEWKSWGRFISDCYVQYKGVDNRRTSSADKGFTEEVVLNTSKYAFKCKSCGYILSKNRVSDFIRNYKLYGCKCGGKENTWERIK